ncbi:sterol desaturase family protein [Paraburkholderia sp. LEh10]|nr:sterol desaturase family protein [Paraburkholderia sp. LEh10]
MQFDAELLLLAMAPMFLACIGREARHARRMHPEARMHGWRDTSCNTALASMPRFQRCSHPMRWLWATHVVRHSSGRMNFSSAFRRSLMDPVVGMGVFWIPLAFLGFAPQHIVGVVLLDLAFRFLVPTQSIDKPGLLGYVLNTPSVYPSHHEHNEITTRIVRRRKNQGRLCNLPRRPLDGAACIKWLTSHLTQGQVQHEEMRIL